MHPASHEFRVLSVAIRFAILAFGSVAPLIAHAELSNDGLLGAGVRTRPAYDGSDTQRVDLVPVIRYFGQPWFARSTQGVLEGGVRLTLTPGLNIGAQIAYEPGRKMSESGFLENHSVPDVNRGASVGAHVEWDTKIGPAPITVLARVRQHTDSDRGAQVDLRLSTGLFQNGRFNAGAFAQATWANAKSTRSLYTITPQQSVTTRLPAFDAGSGLLFGSLGLLWSVDLTRNWIVVGSMEARHLQGDAEHSPLAERSTNYYLSAGVAYHF
jgi:outer membrane scaffolding protein for murein synthesis (MipA/OmpV family)